MSVSQNNTVELNIGGTHYYNVPLELINRNPDSRLAITVSERKEGENPIIEDRNGKRFEYVLDYMRNGTVQLPEGEGKTNFMEELEYYFGLIDVDEASIITYSEANLEALHQQYTKSTLRTNREEMAVDGLNFICRMIAEDIKEEAVKRQAENYTVSVPLEPFSISYQTKDCLVTNMHSLVITCLKTSNLYLEDLNKEFLETINALEILKGSNLVVTQVESEPKLGRKNSFNEIVIRIESTYKEEEEESIDDSTDVEEEVEDSNDTTCSSSNDST